MNYSMIIWSAALVGVPAVQAFVVAPIQDYRAEVAAAAHRASPIFSGVVAHSGVDPEHGPFVLGYFTKIREDCDFSGLIALVGTDALWDRTEIDHRSDQPKGQPTTRPPGTQPFGPWYFPRAEKLSEVDQLRVIAVHECDDTGTGTRVKDPRTGNGPYVEFYERKTPFFTVDFPDD